MGADRIRRRVRSTSTLAAVLVTVAMAMVIGLDAIYLWASRSETILATYQQSESDAKAIAEEANSSIRTALLIAAGAAERLATSDIDPANLASIAAFLRTSLILTPQLDSVSIYDATGRPVLNSAPGPIMPLDSLAPTALDDRRSAIDTTANSTTRVRVNATIRDQTTGRWVIPITRQFSHADGSFAGIVSANLSIDYLVAYYKQLGITPGAAMSLINDEGVLLIRQPRHDEFMGKMLPRWRELGPGSIPHQAGSLYHVSPLDRTEQLVSYQRVADFSLIAFVAVPKTGALVNWRRELWIHAAGIALLIVSFGVAGTHLLCQIRQREAAESDLARRNQFLTTAERLASVGHWRYVESSPPTLEWSEEVYRIHGLPVCQAITPYLAVRAIHLEDRKRVSELVGRALRDGTFISIEMRIVRPDQTIRYCDLAVHPEQQEGDATLACFGTFHDITERKAAEREKETLLERITLAAEAGAVGIFESDLTVDGTYVSPEMCRMYGSDPAKSVYAPKEWMEFVHPADREMLHAWAQDLFEGGEATVVEYRVIRPDGQLRYIRSRGKLRKHADSPAGRLVGVATDVTESRLLEQELQAARNAAEEASRIKSEFLAVVSHEIRTPMNGIIGMNELLLGTGLSDTQRRYAETVQLSADALLVIINDILDTSKLEAGKVELEEVTFDLRSLVDAANELMRPRAAAKDLYFRTEIDPQAAGRFRGDPARLRQVLLNLVSNSVKFTETGGVTLTISTRGRDTLGRTVLRVGIADTGIGLTAVAKGKLFQPFTQADSSISRRFGGTGLGLSISKQLIDLMGGRIAADDRPGGGSVFWFEVPLYRIAPSVEARSDPPCIETVHCGEIGTARGHLLFAEDNDINIKLATIWLERAGFTIDVVRNGLEAIEAVARHTYDLVLMDVQMPELDGLEATRRIRGKQGHGRYLPIIAMTAHASADDREGCLQTGMDDYVSKPIKAEILIEKIRTWIARSALRSEAS